MTTSLYSSTTSTPSRTLETLKSQLKLRMAVKNDLRRIYQETPIRMHKRFPTKKPMQWPKAIRAAYAQIWNGQHRRIIIKAPRGGGKSKLLGTAGFDLWYLKGRSVVNMGGSFVQAEIVYGYFAECCDMDATVGDTVAGEITMTETEAVAGHKFSCVTASTKQTRGKHPDCFFSDETCETSDELIHSALPMVNDSANPLVVMASTFHKIFGIFAETWDNAEERGYTRIQWDIFDVCSTFPADYFENGIMHDGTRVADVTGIDKVKEYAKGRTGDPEGWIPIENVVQAWREKPTVDWFEVEYLGNRPSAAGLVLKPEDVDRAVFDSDTDARYNYINGAQVVIGIDWGFSSMTAVTEFMAHMNQVVVLLDNKNYSQVSSEDIISDIVKKVKEHGIRFIYADSAGKFENAALQNALAKENIGCAVIEVVFSKEKEGMLGNLRAHFEQTKIKIPKKFLDAYYQYKNYRYQEGTDKPVKKNDHIPDSTMCALQHFKLGQFVRSITVPEKETTSGAAPVEARSTGPKPITAGLLKKQF